MTGRGAGRVRDRKGRGAGRVRDRKGRGAGAGAGGGELDQTTNDIITRLIHGIYFISTVLQLSTVVSRFMYPE